MARQSRCQEASERLHIEQEPARRGRGHLCALRARRTALTQDAFAATGRRAPTGGVRGGPSVLGMQVEQRAVVAEGQAGTVRGNDGAQKATLVRRPDTGS